MQRIRRMTAGLCLLAPAALLAQSAKLAGRFEAPFVWGTTPYTYYFNFEIKGDSVSGTSGRLGSHTTYKIGEGRINGNEVSFSWLEGNQPVARFTGTLYEDLLNLEMEEVVGKRLPEAVGGRIHPMTAIRNPGDEPWYSWFPSAVDHTKMGVYRALANVTNALVKKGDWEDAGMTSEILGHLWDANRTEWIRNFKDPRRGPEAWREIDKAMDLFILPIERYRAGKPELPDVEKAYRSYLETMKVGN